ncbi:MAG TPA: tetratricopeptide repeat protein, partial [Myxococcota bacterium]
MRFLTRIGSWLRTGSRQRLPPAATPVEAKPQEAMERGIDAAILARLPSAPVDAFRGRLLDAVQKAHDSEHAVLTSLDSSVDVLIIPRTDGMSAERDKRLSTEIDDSLRTIEASARGLSSLTWSALRDARPPFAPTAAEWAGDLAHRFEGEPGIIFFVDVEAVAIAMCHAAEAQGLSARVDDDAQVVRVSDGRFSAHVGTSALLAEALWTGRGPLSIIARRASGLHGEMRSFTSLLRGLERRFVGLRFDLQDDEIAMRSGDVEARSIDYRHLAAAQRQSGLSVDAWLERALTEDLVLDGADLTILVRSPKYLKAYPDALSQPGDDDKSVMVAVRMKEGAASVVKRSSADHAARFDHYRDEAMRQLPFFGFEGHAFVVEQGTKRGVARAACIVGDKAASVAFHPSLVKGVLEQLVPKEPTARVRAFSENTACFASVHASEELLDEAKKRAAQLEGDLFSDGSDALQIDREINLPEVGHGHFDLTLVPEAYFNVRDQALTRSDLGRGHTDYLRGMSFEILGRPDLAVGPFERAVRQSSSDGEMNLALGRTLSSLGEHPRAVSFLEKAAGALPEHAEAVNALGVALYRSGNADSARQAFQRAVKLAPDEVSFLVNLGRTCCDEHMYGEAKAALDHALRVEPSSAEAHASMAVLCHRTGDKA